MLVGLFGGKNDCKNKVSNPTTYDSVHIVTWELNHMVYKQSYTMLFLFPSGREALFFGLLSFPSYFMFEYVDFHNLSFILKMYLEITKVPEKSPLKK